MPLAFIIALNDLRNFTIVKHRESVLNQARKANLEIALIAFTSQCFMPSGCLRHIDGKFGLKQEGFPQCKPHLAIGAWVATLLSSAAWRKSALASRASGRQRRLKEPTRQQRQGIAQGLGVARLALSLGSIVAVICSPQDTSATRASVSKRCR